LHQHAAHWHDIACVTHLRALTAQPVKGASVSHYRLRVTHSSTSCNLSTPTSGKPHAEGRASVCAMWASTRRDTSFDASQACRTTQERTGEARTRMLGRTLQRTGLKSRRHHGTKSPRFPLVVTLTEFLTLGINHKTLLFLPDPHSTFRSQPCRFSRVGFPFPSHPTPTTAPTFSDSRAVLTRRALAA